MVTDLISGRVSNISVVLFTDIENSVKLRQSLGDDDYGRLKDQHDALFQSLLASAAPNAADLFIKSTGDGFIKLFKTAADAVRFALRFQHGLWSAPWNDGRRMKVRIGVNIGDVSFVQQPSGPDVSGMAVDLAARVMSLARGGQILMTSAPFNSARHNVRQASLAGLPEVRWLEHGHYVMQGWDKPLEVFEVGMEGVSPLAAPASSEKVTRLDEVAGAPAATGWQPAPGAALPDRPEWVLDEQVAEGGFGTVWLGRHRDLGTRHVFKFCRDDNARDSLRVETHVFRKMRQELGARPDIAAIVHVRLEQKPYYVESEYAAGGDLWHWAQRSGGIGAVPLPVRLEMIAQVAEALAAAHSVGVLHKDIKPANILVDESRAAGAARSVMQAKLSDFGIGQIVTPDASATPRRQAPSRMTTGAVVASSYTAPEVIVGLPATTASDVYSLGVLLFQLVVGDLQAPFGQGWNQRVADPLLRQDIASATALSADDRCGAADLAERLRGLDARRARRRRRVLRDLAILGLVTIAVGAGVFAGVTGMRHAWLQQQRARTVKGFLIETLKSIDPDRPGANASGQVTLDGFLQQAAQRLKEGALDNSPGAYAEVQEALASAYLAIGRPQSAVAMLDAAVARQGDPGSGDPVLATRLRVRRAAALVAVNNPASILAADELIRSVDSASLPPDLTAELAAARASVAAARRDFERAAQDFLSAEKFLAGVSPQDSTARVELLVRAGQNYFEAGRYADAEDQLKKARGRLASLNVAGGRLDLLSQSILGKLYARRGQTGEAEEMLLAVLHAQTARRGQEDLTVAYAAGDVALALEQGKRYAAAAEHRGQGHDYAMRHELPPALKMHFHGLYGVCLARAGRLGDAVDPLRRALAEYERVPPADRDGPTVQLAEQVEQYLERAKGGGG